MTEPLLKTERTAIFVQKPPLLPLMEEYYQRNHSHLSAWEPLRNEEYYSREQFLARLEQSEIDFQQDRSVQLVAMDEEENAAIAVCNFTGIIRGPFQACYLGYSIDEKCQGQGYMYEILSESLKYMFEMKKLHRVMANYMPRNERSGRLLEKLGFEKEGFAREYLKIAGNWEDHILTSKIK